MENNNLVIRKMRIGSYKAFSDVGLNFCPLSIIIGENGTGKSTILDCIRTPLNLTIPEDIDVLYHKRNVSNPVTIVLEFQGEYELLDINLLETDYLKHYVLSCNDIQFRFTYFDKENVLLEYLIPKFEFFIKDITENRDNSQDKYLIGTYRDWSMVFTTKADINKERSSSNISTNILSAVTNFLSNKYNINSRSFSISSSSRGPKPIHYTFNIEIKIEDKRGNLVNFHCNPLSNLPNFVFIDPFRKINKRSTLITEDEPFTSNLRSTPEGLISFFHYARIPEYKPYLKTIFERASEFGLFNLESVPSTERKIGLQYEDQIYKENFDVTDGGLGVGQLIFLIAECILAKPGTILLIDEPETHLHAKFQAKIMDLIIDTVNRGIQIIVATHSEYFILRLQRRIAAKKIKSNQVIILETSKSKKKKKLLVKEHHLDVFGNYKGDPPEVIKFAQKEFQQWAKVIKESD